MKLTNFITDTLIPYCWVGGVVFLLCKFAYFQQFDLLFLAIITVLNSLVLSSMMVNPKRKK